MTRNPGKLISILVNVSLLLTLIAGAGQPTEASANVYHQKQTYYVAPGGGCGNASPCFDTIQAAVDQAAAGDEIRIAAGVYTGVNSLGGLSQVVYLNKSIELRGGFTTANWDTPDPAANITTIDAQTQGRVIAIIGPAEVTVTGLRLSGGNASGLRGDPNNPTTINAGGGVYIRSAQVYLDQVQIVNNIASSEASKPGNGGGIYLYESSLQLNDSLLEANLGSPIYFGSGGGLYINSCADVSLTRTVIQDNTGSTNQGNAGGGNGGGISIHQSTVTLTDNTIRRNITTTGPGTLSYASGGGIYVSGNTSQVTLTGNLISENTASGRKEGWGGGIAIQGASSAHLVNNTIERNAATTSPSLFGQGGGIYAADNVQFTLNDNHILNNSATHGDLGMGWGGGIFITGGSAILNNNLISGNTANQTTTGLGGGLLVENANFEMTNNLVAGNHAGAGGSGLHFISTDSPGHLGILVHTTIANNIGGSGLDAAQRARLELTNTIISGHDVAGITHALGATLTLESTLWHDNEDDVVGIGTITKHNDYSGDPVFAAPFTGDYHLTGMSAAIDKGIDAQINTDIDKQARPNGNAPDLGADEYYPLTGQTYAEKTAFMPQWFATFDPASGIFHNYINQRYLLHFQHFEPQDQPVTITDTLPENFTFSSEVHTPSMDFQQHAGALDWQTTQPLPPGQAAQILLNIVTDQLMPFTSYTNTAQVQAGPQSFDLQVTSQAPLAPPLITSPGPGEICPGQFEATGSAYPNTVITLYLNQVEIANTTAGSNGAFSVNLNLTQLSQNPTDLTAKACMPDPGGQCSTLSSAIELLAPTSFICPQRSIWENTPVSGPMTGQQLIYRFRDANGKFVGHNGLFEFVPPHINSQVHLYRRSCEQMGTPPVISESVTIEIMEGSTVIATYSPKTVNLPLYHFQIDMDLADGVERDVIFNLMCIWTETPTASGADTQASTIFSANLDLSEDQAGVVFDSTKGYDPVNPDLSAINGARVTAMVFNPAWGGWVPWPAHLYNEQLNPQVTGPDGSFLFLAPPGKYYLYVDGSPNYMPWRSPVYEITSTPLRATIPLTPQTTGGAARVDLGSAGPDPINVSISAGQSVEWVVPVDNQLTPQEHMNLIDNPVTRLHTTDQLDPLNNPRGWDSGMLIPGSVYRRQFIWPGRYSYNDGAGHSATVTVQVRLYLPMALR